MFVVASGSTPEDPFAYTLRPAKRSNPRPKMFVDFLVRFSSIANHGLLSDYLLDLRCPVRRARRRFLRVPAFLGEHSPTCGRVETGCRNGMTREIYISI
jgi:hypothetical protein